MIQEEIPVFWDVIVSVIVGEKDSFYEHVSNSECLTRQSHLNVWFESARFLFVRKDEEPSLQNKGGYTRRIADSHFGCCRLRKESVKIN